MPALTLQEIGTLLAPYLEPPAELLPQLSAYLDLLLDWNARTNLTAIRTPEDIVRRHFGESLFTARHLPLNTHTLLDFGSGAGFPGLPIALLLPHLHVTLAESQGKKSTFLREAIRTLNLHESRAEVPSGHVEVWAGRVEALPPHQRFDIITMRAVDKMDRALPVAVKRLAPTGTLVLLTTAAPISSLTLTSSFAIPNSDRGTLQIYSQSA